jgi:hypothetical protein
VQPRRKQRRALAAEPLPSEFDEDDTTAAVDVAKTKEAGQPEVVVVEQQPAHPVVPPAIVAVPLLPLPLAIAGKPVIVGAEQQPVEGLEVFFKSVFILSSLIFILKLIYYFLIRKLSSIYFFNFIIEILIRFLQGVQVTKDQPMYTDFKEHPDHHLGVGDGENCEQ